MRKPYAFIADDHAAVRMGLSRLCEDAGIGVTGMASTIEETLSSYSQDKSVALILDLNLGKADGVKNIERVLAANPDGQIVVYSMRESIETISSAYKAGVMAYIGKSMDPEYLVEAVRAVTFGGRRLPDGRITREYYPPGLQERITAYYANSREKSPRDALTNRDFETFLGLAEGKSHELLATQMKVSKRTIYNKSSHICRTLGIDRSDFTVIARAWNYIE